MPAAIETMAYTGERPWHGLGVEIPEEAKRDYQRMMVLAGLDWTVSKHSLVTTDGLSNMDDFAYAIRRDSDQKVLGAVGTRYEPLQNLEAFQWFLPFVEAGEAYFETAGSLFGGQRVWILARINRSPIEVTVGDAVNKYVLLAHAHDGSLSIIGGLTGVRVVCNNTLQMAASAGKASANFFKFKHTENASERLAQVAEKIAEADVAFTKTAEAYRFLAARRYSAEKLKSWLVDLFAPAASQEHSKLSTKAKNIIENITARVESGMGNDRPANRGTWWSAYNGVTEYLSHERGHNQDTRLNALWFGDGATKSQKALQTALLIAA